MRDLMKMTAAMAVVAGATMSASASLKQFGAVEAEMLGSRFALRGSVTGIGFEAAEGYVLGNIAGQNGWVDNSTPAAPRGTMTVADGVAAGNGSANALKLSKGPQSTGSFGIAQAPLTPNATQVTVDTRIDDDGGANYFVRGLLLTQSGAALSFRVEFDYGGSIFVQNPLNGTFVNTNTPWAVGNTWSSLDVKIVSDGVSSTIEYRYGGNLIGTSPGLPAVFYFDLVQFGHDNYQNFLGAESFSGLAPAGYFDNLNVIPAPGAMALLGLGGLIAGRRRRA
jgi:hypothetical protein